MIPRRLLLLSLVAICALNLAGCATVDLQCGIRIDYEAATPPVQQGEAVLRWRFGDASKCASTSYGCFDGETVYLRASPDLTDVCSLAKLGHEVSHLMGARHEPR